MNSTEEDIIRMKAGGKSLRSIVEESGVSLSKVRTILGSTKNTSTTESIPSKMCEPKLPTSEIKMPKSEPQGAYGVPYEAWDNSETPEAEAKNRRNFPKAFGSLEA